MRKDDQIYVDHIIACIRDIETYAASNRTRLDNSLYYDATTRKLQIMAESTQRLSESLKQEFPHIPWHKLAGFRNILVHDYLGDIDADILWDVIVNSLPELLTAMRQWKERE